jgi:hypothetical protein
MVNKGYRYVQVVHVCQHGKLFQRHGLMDCLVRIEISQEAEKTEQRI